MSKAGRLLVLSSLIAVVSLGCTSVRLQHSITRQATTLSRKAPGARVNLEADLIGKYVERLLAGRVAGLPGGGVTLELLKEHGFAD